MLSFATEFPINHTVDSASFLGVTRTWILGSPHTRLAEEDLAHLLAFGESRIQKGNELIEALLVSAGEEETAAFRYTRRDDGLEWVTTVVFARTGSDSWVGVRVSSESSHPATRLPPAKKPVVVRALLSNLGGASDGVLPVESVPFRLKDTDIGLASLLINSESGCRLPIVYVSAGFHGNYLVDADRLARELGGMAHVVVEPNRAFSLRLKFEVNSENVYGGTVGVYWPDGGGRRSFFLGRQFDSADEVARAVFEEIRTALLNRRPLDRCTWAYAQGALSRQSIQTLRASGSREVDKYIETFDKELAASAERLRDAEREILRLQSELRIYEARLPSGIASLLRAGNEQDFFENEVFAIVRSALEDACTRVVDDSRRKHVLTSVLQANPLGEDIASSMRERLKELLRGSKGLDAKTRRGLEEMGFSVSEDGKHYKLVFQGDDRYTFTLPKSGSDHRGGLNAASDIGRLLF